MKLRKWLKRALFAFAALLTLACLALAVENYRGKRVWARYRAELEAKGEILDWARLVPQPVPDDQNFAATPLLQPFSDYVVSPQTHLAELRDTNACDQVTRRFAWPRPSPEPTWRLAEATDLKAWQTALRTAAHSDSPALQALAARPAASPVEDLKFFLAQYQAAMDELRAAVRRPYANFKTRYQDGLGLLLPHVAALKSFTTPFRLSAIVNLASDHPDAALADVQVILGLGDKIAAEPLLITALVRQAMIEPAIQAVWEGLARHQWTEPQLAQLEGSLARVNLVAEMLRALRAECAFTLAVLGQSPVTAAGTDLGPAEYRMLRYWPSGFICQNQYHIARAFHEAVLPGLDPAGPTVVIKPRPDLELEAHLRPRTPYNIFASLLLPAISNTKSGTALHQASVGLARVACALERYRLAHGTYPESLDAVRPQYLTALPPDPVNGEPLRYRRTAPDRYTLYSVGVNLTDDGGTVMRDKKQQPLRREPGGDWVWPCQIGVVVAATSPVADQTRR